MAEEDDFVEFVVLRRPALVRLGWALTGDRQHGEDLAQMVLDRVWRRWGKVAAGGDPWPYVQRIAVTLAHNWRRRRWHGESAAGVAPKGSTRDPSTSDVDLRLTVDAWLRSLPRRQRTVIVLRYLADLSVEETAERLSCTTGTVKSQTSKALESLRNELMTSRAGETEFIHDR